MTDAPTTPEHSVSSDADYVEHDEIRAARQRNRQQMATLLSGPVILNRATLRSFVAVFTLVVLVLSDDSPDRVGGILGLALVASALIDVAAYVSQRRRVVRGASIRLDRVAAQLVVGLVLVAWPQLSIGVLELVLAFFFWIHGAIDLVQASRKANNDRAWLLTRGVVALVLGVFTAFFPGSMATLAAIVVAVVWILAGVVAVVYTSRGDRLAETVDIDPASTWRIVATWLREHELASEERSFLTDKLFFEGALQRQRFWRFVVLMFLSVSIATFAVVQDSTAVIIGAMLIAPLMTPIMATTAALTMGWPKRALRASMTVLFGVVFAIFVAWLIVQALPNVPDPVSTSQITSRTSPTMIDMLIALAAGAAGAFALTRSDVSDSLPGVAIAVALVPPLSVVGVTIEAGQYSDAAGAFLLFATNFVSILIAGGIVFVVTGYTPIRRMSQERKRIRSWMVAVGIGAIVLIIPLALTGRQIAADAAAFDEATETVTSWLDGTDFEGVDIVISGSDVEVIVAGPSDSEAPRPQDLADQLADRLGREVNLDLRVIPERRFIRDGAPDQ